MDFVYFCAFLWLIFLPQTVDISVFGVVDAYDENLPFGYNCRNEGEVVLCHISHLKVEIARERRFPASVQPIAGRHSRWRCGASRSFCSTRRKKSLAEAALNSVGTRRRRMSRFLRGNSR